MEHWRWMIHTAPFSAEHDAAAPARFVLEQIDDGCFRPAPSYGFRYQPPDGGEPLVVTARSLPHSDFASVPTFLSWFVSRYGRHTPAALVHDQLVRDGMTQTERAAADQAFLSMMEACDVPPVRSHVMWSAVTLATRWMRWPTRLALLAWGLAATAGLVALGAGLVRGEPTWCAVALVAPAPAALLWGRQAKAGLVAGYALPPVVVPALASIAGYAVYWVVEEGFRRLRSLPPSRDVHEHPTPVPFGNR